MRAYIFQTGLFAIALSLLTAASLWLLPANISADYWVRAMLVEKEAFAESKPSPRVLFFGDSSSWFGFDAARFEKETGIPAINFGLVGVVRLDRTLYEAAKVSRAGDIVVLAPIETDYNCMGNDWNSEVLRSILAWDRTYFFSLPRVEQAHALIMGGSPGLLIDQWMGLVTKWLGLVPQERSIAMASPDQVLARWRSGKFRPAHFEYSQYNIDDHGTPTQTDDALAGRVGSALVFKEMCPATSDMLGKAVAKFKHRGIRLVFAHAPRMIVDTPPADWQGADARLHASFEKISTVLIDRHEELFFPPEYFFNSRNHLNTKGRVIWTDRMIADLRRLSLIPVNKQRDPGAVE